LGGDVGVATAFLAHDATRLTPAKRCMSAAAT